MPGGEQRIANVEMLIEKACAFEGTSYKGLFNFVRYIEQLKKYNVDYGEAGIMDEQADTVRLMSIHKSKGLEFPIVFVAGMGKSFNMQDQRGSIVIHPDWGIGIDAVDLEQRTKNPTFLKRMIQEKTKAGESFGRTESSLCWHDQGKREDDPDRYSEAWGRRTSGIGNDGRYNKKRRKAE